MRTYHPRLGAIVVAAALAAGCAATATDRTAGNFIDDSATTARVKTALVREAGRVASEVNVTTYRGMVQLAGFVDSQQEKAEAERIASGVQGVQQVMNDLRVKPPMGAAAAGGRR